MAPEPTTLTVRDSAGSPYRLDNSQVCTLDVVFTHTLMESDIESFICIVETDTKDDTGKEEFSCETKPIG